MGNTSKLLKVYLTEDGWAYDGCYQKIGNLVGITDRNEKLWTMLGALIMELISANVLEVTIYNDSRLVEEWNDDVQFISTLSRNVAIRLKNQFARKFVKLTVSKLDRHSIDSEMKNLQLL